MNKLDSMNMLLKYIRVRPVASLDVQHPDAVDAVKELEQQARRVMAGGWWFNTVKGVVHQPDPVTKHIQVARNVISISLTDPRDLRMYPLIALRDQLVFDGQRNTFKFDESLELTVHQELEWNHMPETAQNYIMLMAGEIFVSNKTADEVKRRELERKVIEASADMVSEDMTTKQYNVFNTPRVAQARSGRRPFARR